ncbi:MAG: ORF6N domain-containing protein [Ferruginibacter sp.]|nr:ORF6N domain-containing protein [Ferruginibacter sp.]
MKEIFNNQNFSIENKIFTIRGMPVMLDRDLALRFQTETRTLKQGVRRNMKRFSPEFMFELTEKELDVLVSQFVIPQKKQAGGSLPFAFTEQGVAMLTTIIKNDFAIQTSIQIMHAFIKMRKILPHYAQIIQRIEGIEVKQFKTESQIEQIFTALEKADKIPAQGIFFNGQIFDAYKFVSDIIKKAKNTNILIDNYIDESTLALLSKKNKNVKTTIYTERLTKTNELDFKKWSDQYGNLDIQILKNNHDRFLIIDQKEMYHIGASLKDMGKKIFAFSRMDNAIKLLINGLRGGEG